VQGFGNVGMNFAQIAANDGYKIVAVSDSKGGIYNIKGLNIKEAIKHKNKTGGLIGFANSKDISNKELLELPVEILAPAAMENVINKNNAKKINSRIDYRACKWSNQF